MRDDVRRRPADTFAAREPRTPEEWDAYYTARWQWLRAPLGQPRGSERDKHEGSAVHRAVFDAHGAVLAVGRLHLIDAANARVRYVASAPACRRLGHGRTVMNVLEAAARRLGVRRVYLHARRDVVSFYLRLGYRATGAAPALYGTLAQTMMEKQITPRR
ncbi:MAG: GNAT family N-acetyltransferase [Opitutales bacterium]|nr:GNAT family N-acetyltransferase [Opitutales bacterium]